MINKLDIPSVTIIIPHYNLPELLERCVESIPDSNIFQVIIIDDNSSDLIVDFNNFPGQNRNNTEIIFNKCNKGAGHARNLGLEQSKGKWLLFADSDDFFEDNLIEKLKPFLDSPSDIVMFKANSVDSKTLLPSNRNENINKQIDNVIYAGKDKKEAALEVHSPWCRLIKRNLIEKNHIKFDEVIASNDTMFTTKATILANDIVFSDSKIYNVTYREGSLWDLRKTNSKNFFSRIEVSIRRNKYLKENGFKPDILIGFLKSAYQINIKTFLKTLFILSKEKIIFKDLKTLLIK